MSNIKGLLKTFIKGIYLLIFLAVSCKNKDDIEPMTTEFENKKAIESISLSYNSLTNRISEDGVQEKQINRITEGSFIYRVSFSTSSEKYLKSIVGLQFDLDNIDYSIGKPLSGKCWFDEDIEMNSVLVSASTQLLWPEIHSEMQKKHLYIQCDTETEVVLWFISNQEVDILNYNLEPETSIKLNITKYKVNPHEEVFEVGSISGTEYSWVKIDNQRWTATDYYSGNYGGKIVVFENEPLLENPFNGKDYYFDGKIVLIEELLQSTPPEWHIPSIEEWNILLDRNMNTSITRGNHLISEYNGIDSYGMSLKFSRSGVYPFNSGEEQACYLTSSKNDSGVIMALGINKDGTFSFFPINYSGIENEVRGCHVRFVQNV
ncbi:hypothetical protein LVD17_27025 [Fulvivirga ulvae]|uniref:hypothetical protein n=1 Tax=Fulvivirga ulvae TaxID=2904245 RepID=UPI001F16AE4D|nr:hypothetical protein [Fulvivirga ulvae]UII31946.1 hypothetical protein LVD17_27025 [Fulvivirga ulvae]